MLSYFYLIHTWSDNDESKSARENSKDSTEQDLIHSVLPPVNILTLADS